MERKWQSQQIKGRQEGWSALAVVPPTVIVMPAPPRPGSLKWGLEHLDQGRGGPDSCTARLLSPASRLCGLAAHSAFSIRFN